MSKVTDAVIAALIAKFETGDIPDGTDFSSFIEAVQEAAQDHEHNAEGGSGSGTGDAGKVAWSTGLSGIPSTFPPSTHNHDTRYFTEDEHIATSTGAPDSGKPIKLNASGLVDESMLGDVGGGATFPTLVVAAVDSLDTSRADYVCEGVSDTLIDDCEDAWTEATGTGVTSEADTVDKQVGTASAKMTLGSNLGEDALIASEAVAPTDIPKGAVIHLWFKTNDFESGAPDICLSTVADLGNVVYNAALWVDESDTWVHLSTDPLPAALEDIISVGLTAGADGLPSGTILHVDQLEYYTADEVVINEALDALPDGGGCVALLEGEYSIAGPVKVPSHCSLVGAGKGTVLKRLTGLHAAGGPDLKSSGVIENLDKSGGNTEIVIASLAIDGNADNVTGGYEGIELTKVTYGVVVDLFIEACSSRGIILSSGSHNTVRHNVICDASMGLQAVGEACTLVVCNTVIEGNTGMYLGGNELTITGNVIRLTQLNAVYLYGTNNSLFSGNYLFEASQVTDNSWSLLAIQSCDYNLIANNVLRKGALTNKAKYGIRVIDAGSTKNMLHGNDLYASAETTDLIDGGTGTQKRDNRNNAGDGWIADV